MSKNRSGPTPGAPLVFPKAPPKPVVPNGSNTPIRQPIQPSNNRG